jgi:transcriptional regulator with XRE-family HTH domain
VSTNLTRRQQIAESLRDKEYRDLFVTEHIDTGVPFQIRAMRRDRGWSQKELAQRVGMTQEGVSRLENPDYGKLTITTLKRLASALDVGLDLSPKDLIVPDFAHDLGLQPNTDSLPSAQTADWMPSLSCEVGTPAPEVLRSPASGLSTWVQEKVSTATRALGYTSARVPDGAKVWSMASDNFAEQENSPTPAQDRTLEVVDADIAPVIYTNNVVVRMSVWDIVLDFGYVLEASKEKLKVRQLASIAMSPQHAKAFARLLNDRVELYERTYGPLPQAGVIHTSEP